MPEIGDEHSHFIIYVDDTITVLKLDQDGVTECVHTIIPPENMMIHATGGVLSIPRGNGVEEQAAVICGGEFEDASLNSKCMILNKNKPPSTSVARSPSQVYHLSAGGFLNIQRTGGASLVIDNGKALWVTGGSADWDSSEFVEIVNNSNNIFPTNGVGPSLLLTLRHHCLETISHTVAMIMGGNISKRARKR